MPSLHRLAPGAYLVSALLVLFSLVDYAGNAWPFVPGDVSWRYGVVGMVSTYLLSPLLGALIASVVAAEVPHPLVSRVLSWLMWLAGIVLLVALAGFVLDSIQVRSAAAAEARWVTTTSFLLASSKILGGSLAWIALAVGNGRVAKKAAKDRPAKGAPIRPIVGQS